MPWDEFPKHLLYIKMTLLFFFNIKWEFFKNYFSLVKSVVKFMYLTLSNIRRKNNCSQTLSANKTGPLPVLVSVHLCVCLCVIDGCLCVLQDDRDKRLLAVFKTHLGLANKTCC